MTPALPWLPILRKALLATAFYSTATKNRHSTKGAHATKEGDFSTQVVTLNTPAMRARSQEHIRPTKSASMSEEAG